MPYESVFYRLEVDLECTSRKNYSIVYCQGISPSLFQLSPLSSYRILKIYYDDNGECHVQHLERYIKVFQRKWRQWRIFQKQIFRHLRLRQLGLSQAHVILCHLL